VRYDLEFRKRAAADLASLDHAIADRILQKLDRMRDDLVGDVKRLRNFSPDYRLRVGDYRVLFAVNFHKIIVYRVVHRREAY